MVIFLLRKFSLLVILISTGFLSTARASYDYHVVIDGGGSSSTLQVLDPSGNLLQLKKTEGRKSNEMIGGCANINTVGLKGFVAVLHELFDNLMVGEVDPLPFERIIPHSILTLGLAGMGLKEAQQKVGEILESFGFSKDQLNLYTDVGLALKLVKNSGGVLISGTGSICFAKEQDKIFRCGGLGRVLGDQGSGYQIGLKSIQYSLEQEYGWGLETAVYERIKDFFDCELLGSIIGPIQRGEIDPKTIASITPWVFEAAYKGDFVCSQILDHAAYDLGTIAAHALKNLKETNPIVYLIGGVFKNEHSDSFIKKIAKSSPIQELGKQPIFVNISEINYAAEVVREKRLASQDPDALLNSLPFVKGEFQSFSQAYGLANLTTEMVNKKTQMLSETFQGCKTDAIHLLHQVDSEMAQGTHVFLQSNGQSFSNALYQSLADGGRLFFIGAGSSGRVASDLEAKWNAWEGLDSCYKHKVIGMIAGGPRALIQEKAGFEDSEIAGAESLSTSEVGPKDVVVLISASASAKFNIGAGRFASSKGASVFYFYNTQCIPSYAKQFMTEQGVKPLLLDVGAQSIAGSTRLQSASIAKLCLGICLSDVAKRLGSGQNHTVSPLGLYQTAHNGLPNHFHEIAHLVELELEVFQSPSANFYRNRDEMNQGYVTFICSKGAMREVMFDCVEMSPTFSLTPVCSLSDTDKKRAELRAYQLSYSGSTNRETWEELLNRPLNENEQNVKDFLINTEVQGTGSYQSRPKGKGNLLIGVLTGTPDSKELQELSSQLATSAEQGGKIGIIAVLTSKASSDLIKLANKCDASLIIDQLGEDSLGISETLVLKETLNLISNCSMIGMDKVYGNIMIDLAPSNQKLINRSIRIVRDIYNKRHPYSPNFTEELLYNMVIRVFAYKKLMETQHGIYIPPPIRIVLAMIENKCCIKEAIEILRSPSYE